MLQWTTLRRSGWSWCRPPCAAWRRRGRPSRGRRRRAAGRANGRGAARAAGGRQRPSARRRDRAALGGALGRCRPGAPAASLAGRRPERGQRPRRDTAGARLRERQRGDGRRSCRRGRAARMPPRRAGETVADGRGPRPGQPGGRRGAAGARRSRQREGTVARPDGADVGGRAGTTAGRGGASIAAGADVRARVARPPPDGAAQHAYGDQNSVTRRHRDRLGGFTPTAVCRARRGRRSARHNCSPPVRTSRTQRQTAPARSSSPRTAARARWRRTSSSGAPIANAADAGYTALHAAVLRGESISCTRCWRAAPIRMLPLAKGTPSRYYSKDYAFDEASSAPRRSGWRRGSASRK